MPQVNSEQQAARDKAFGLGSDARIKGVPLTGNPWYLDDDKEIGSLFWHWSAGHRHVDRFWGVDNKRYVLLQLPGIRKLPWLVR